MVAIREATEADYDAIWKIFQGVVSAGDSYFVAMLDGRLGDGL